MLLNEQWAILTTGFLAVWLGIVSVLLYRLVVHYRKVTTGVGSGNLITLLEKILTEQKEQGKGIETLSAEVEKLKKESNSHLQRLGLVRFNPFSETGGNQSFTLAILNGKNSGLLISSLHSRENTRIYAKTVMEGKSEATQFSKEENEAITQASKT